MITLNKQKISKILLNKQKISKIILNKQVVYEESIPNGGIITELPRLVGYKDYFIFLLQTHTPLGNTENPVKFVSNELKTAITNLVSGVDTQTNLKIANPGVAETNRIITDLGLQASSTSSDTIYTKGIFRTFGYKKINGKLVYMFLVGQKNTGYFDKVLQTVSEKISVSIDNNITGNSAFGIYLYCIKYRPVFGNYDTNKQSDAQTSDYGEYKLLSSECSYNKVSNKLSTVFDGKIYDYQWFDGLKATPY